MTIASSQELRPSVDRRMHAEDFERWYWPVEHLKRFCDVLELHKSGTKAELRERVTAALRHPGQNRTVTQRRRPAGSFNWSKETLTRDTIITDTVSFGPNVRSFFKAEIGKTFVCHSDFMDWVRGNPGASLGDAVAAWLILEERKDDPTFRREIASCNNYLQYLRDARDRNPGLSLHDAKRCWDYKNVRPARDGYVIFEQKDVLDAGIDM
ncbi:MAG: DUF6434 domain-containing protein [Pseudomonadota bacterium]